MYKRVQPYYQPVQKNREGNINSVYMIATERRRQRRCSMSAVMTRNNLHWTNLITKNTSVITDDSSRYLPRSSDLQWTKISINHTDTEK